ncbi:unnamed protein product [Fusarium venenatum]|uniref:Uncharacterized protein n=1 Tax=Fusarium venenatum TaxID=56646 RepID=A0A2L2TW06_9HYPO|nr:uncharacterized protein FVRRES_11038 [Fusarium venenatum]CEI70961.1 unnamed protein product [Fusarium venenatum]
MSKIATLEPSGKLEPGTGCSNRQRPPNRVQRHKKVTPYKRDALLGRLADCPTTYRTQMVTYLRDKFEDNAFLSTMSRSLKDTRWTRKNCHPVAQQRNPKLREL